MKIVKLTDSLSVSEQISPEDVAAIATIIVTTVNILLILNIFILPILVF